MNNSLRLIIDAVLVVAVAVLFYLHFSSKPAAAPVAAKTAVVQPVAKDDDDTTATAAEPLVAVADTEKVAYVESGKLLEGYKAMQDARRAFETKARGWE